MADQSSPYEAQVFVDTYPSGKSWARDIDDFMREILNAVKFRLNDEHFWRNVGTTGEDGEPDYEVTAEGRHRPSSARVWVMGVDTGGIPTTSFGSWTDLDADLRLALDNAVLAFRVLSSDGGPAEPTTTQMVGRWEGSTWFIHGSKLRPLIHKLRGAVDFMGLMRFGPVKSSYHGQQLHGLTVDENLGGLRPQLDVPSYLSDAHTYECYWAISGLQEHPDEDTEALPTRVVYPIRVGALDRYGKNRSPEQQGFGAAASFGLLWEVINSDEQAGGTFAEWLRLILTTSGLEFFTGPEAGRNILINGINLWKHNHSGEATMGVPFDWSKAKDTATALCYSTYNVGLTDRIVGPFGPADQGLMKEIFTDETDVDTGIFAPKNLYPIDEDGVVEDIAGMTRIFQFDLEATISALAWDIEVYREFLFVVSAELSPESYAPPTAFDMPNIVGCFPFVPYHSTGNVGAKKHTFTAIVPGVRSSIAPANGRLHFHIAACAPNYTALSVKLAISVATWRR